MNDRSELRDAMLHAAMMLAVSVDIADRIATDPTHPGDRGPRADEARARMRSEDLERYRAARAAFEAVS